MNASGLNGTKFVSDLTLTNPGTAPATVVVSFLPAGSSTPHTLSLAAGQTLVSRNVLDGMFGTSGAGALSISSDQPVLVRAKTYNASQNGTYGVALPVFADDRLLSPGETGDALWISQDASGSLGYRTNIALVFPDATGGTAAVTIYDAEGNERGHQDFSLDAPGLQQFSVGSFAGAVAVGRAQVAVTRGRAAGYAVVVDNVTGDSSLFSFEDLPAGRQDALVNGVARANGRNGAFFRTDGRFYNPTDTEATVTVSLHASGNANPSPASASFTLGAGKIRDVVDVLDALLGLPVGSAGALRFQSDWPVAILCRTSNVDPSGARLGTFGSQQKPVPLLSFVTSADAGAAITGLRQDAAFRTNVGFAAGADGARYSLTLSSASGASIATTTASLGAWGWTQPGIQDLFPTVTIPLDATLHVKVSEGSLDVFDSSIDNLSGDPVVTPIAPLPVAIPSSATIGPAGGSIQSDDGRLTLRVPAGALSSAVSLSFVTEASNDAPQGTGPSYVLSPGDLAFARPLTLALHYGSDELRGSGAGKLGIAFQDGSTWYVVTGGSIDAAARTLTVPADWTTAAAATARSTLLGPRRGELPRRWAGFRSVEIFPKRAAVLTQGSLELVALDVGNSSAERTWVEGAPPSGVSPLSPADPNRAIYTWKLNGESEHIAGPEHGTLVSYGNNATYWAPRCTPNRNPVTVSVRLLARNSPPTMRYSTTLWCDVRVLPRDWEFTATLTASFRCPAAFASDFVGYEVETTFSLDDMLKVTNVVQKEPRLVAFDPEACDAANRDLNRKVTQLLEARLQGGSFNAMRDKFDLGVEQVFPGSPGYHYTYVAPDGTQFPDYEPEGPAIPMPPTHYFLREGENRIPYPIPSTAAIYNYTFYVDRKPTGCP